MAALPASRHDAAPSPATPPQTTEVLARAPAPAGLGTYQYTTVVLCIGVSYTVVGSLIKFRLCVDPEYR